MIRATCEVIFLRPADLSSAIPELETLDFDVEILDDWVDDHGPAQWALVSARTELDLLAFFDLMKTVVEPLGGDAIEVGIYRQWREPH